MTLIEGRFDRRAVHRIFSEPVALDVVMDVEALLQEIKQVVEACHLVGLGYGDNDLTNGHVRIFNLAQRAREITHSAAGLIEGSVIVDPYKAVAA